jgi:cystathionine beta-lyase
LLTDRPTSRSLDELVCRRESDSIKWSYYDEDVLPMWVADMDFPSPEPVIAALRRRVEHGVFGYPAEPPELRLLMVDRLQRLYGWSVSPDALVFLPNVAVGFNLACRAAAAPGDGVLIQPPIYFPILSVPENARLTANLARLARSEDGRYAIDFDAIEATITDRTRVFILCNPHNPVGRVYTRGELERMADICLRHDIVICSDEIHADFTFDGRPHVPIASIGEEVERRTITLISPTKSFNLAGIQCAVAVIPDRELRKRYVASKRGLVPSVGAFGYTAALAAYQHGEEWLGELVDYLQANRDELIAFVDRELHGMTVSPVEGTYLAWLNCRGLNLQEIPSAFFLREARVALFDGTLFGSGGGGFVRLNFGCARATLKQGLERILSAVKRL